MKGYHPLRVVLGVSGAAGLPDIAKQKQQTHRNATESFYVVTSAKRFLKCVQEIAKLELQRDMHILKIVWTLDRWKAVFDWQSAQGMQCRQGRGLWGA